MPIPINGFRCETCIAFYPTEQEAKQCEAGHTKLEDLKIKSAHFRSLAGLYGHDREEARVVPYSIRVRFGSDPYAVALYRLDSIGPKGV